MISLYFYWQLNKVKKAEIPKTNSELNISNNAAEQNDEITNIALFGVDRRNKDEASRSDALMILTLDKKHKKVKISSVMRDSYVNVDGYGMTKVNHAYAYGGPTLAIKTLNKNFDLNIKDYVTVDFFGFEKIIDSVGGVDIFERTQRQRTVLVAILNKIKATSPKNIVNVTLQLMPYTETSMSNAEILKSVTSISILDIKNIEQERFPLDGYCNGKMIGGVWYLVFDLEATKNQMHKYIFEDIRLNVDK